MKTIVLTLLFWLCVLAGWAQQDPLYSQYQFNQLMINPAYAGIYDRFSVGMMSRFQWVGINGAPTTHTFTTQKTIKDGKVGLGGIILQDKFGVNTNTELQIAYSYNIVFNGSKLSMGLQTGLVNFGYNFQDLEMDYLDDPRLNTGQENFTKPNFGVGFMYTTDIFYLGMSIPRILDVSINDGVVESTRYLRHYYFSGGLVFDVDMYTKARVTTLVRYVADGRVSGELNISALIDKRAWGGLTVRDFKHFGIFTMFEATKKLRLGYSFELPANSLIRSSFGTHELMVFYRIQNRQDKLEQRYF